MNQILFATSNARKIEEANGTLSHFDISVKSVKIDIDEIQHQDSVEITKAKVRATDRAGADTGTYSDSLLAAARLAHRAQGALVETVRQGSN